MNFLESAQRLLNSLATPVTRENNILFMSKEKSTSAVLEIKAKIYEKLLFTNVICRRSHNVEIPGKVLMSFQKEIKY